MGQRTLKNGMTEPNEITHMLLSLYSQRYDYHIHIEFDDSLPCYTSVI